ncbi:hypothetical protein DPMN_143977 [Dreissena polymorpha]|uniref:Uncharacterized protein n=1 Tax=Dreissena polymorpha TaxID=45954 RepID=A0A9D4GE17_DREPO|nr:hypothetical protein DPMN_143977 [Dreissena polymorpha]
MSEAGTGISKRVSPSSLAREPEVRELQILQVWMDPTHATILLTLLQPPGDQPTGSAEKSQPEK